MPATSVMLISLGTGGRGRGGDGVHRGHGDVGRPDAEALVVDGDDVGCQRWGAVDAELDRVGGVGVGGRGELQAGDDDDLAGGEGGGHVEDEGSPEFRKDLR